MDLGHSHINAQITQIYSAMRPPPAASIFLLNYRLKRTEEKVLYFVSVIFFAHQSGYLLNLPCTYLKLNKVVLKKITHQ